MSQLIATQRQKQGHVNRLGTSLQQDLLRLHQTLAHQ